MSSESDGYRQAAVRIREYRPNFVAQITCAAAALGADVTWLSSNYIALIAGEGIATQIVGYHFPLNDSAAAALATDKSAASDVLAHHGIPHVPHVLVRFKGRKRLDLEAGRVTRLLGFPLVVKPYRGTGGRDVTVVACEESLVPALLALRPRHQALTACPWLDIQHEYRVVVLDGETPLIFEKARPAVRRSGRRTGGGDEWRHNLRYGATPVIQAERALGGALTGIAVAATRALGLRFAAVDIVASGEGLSVLEVNSGVCLERFSGFSPDHFRQAGEVYYRALRACAVPAAGLAEAALLPDEVLA
jgi:glutathione synthase/RimK-type ligase-like ATP-grasp enzyme